MTVIMVVAGFLFCLGVGLHGRPRRLVEQPGVGHHDLRRSCSPRWCCCCCSAATRRSAPVAAIMIGAVVCCAACVAGDNLQDLKCGYIVGATPWKQQLMLAIGAVSCALIMAPVLNLLLHGLRHRRADGRASESAARAAGEPDGVGRQGHVRRRTAVEHDRASAPASAPSIIAFDLLLKARGAKFRVAGAGRGDRHLPAARTDGADLPRRPARAPRRAQARRRRRTKPSRRIHRKGMLFSAGLITGEALMGIFIAIPIVVTGRADVLALPGSPAVRRLAGPRGRGLARVVAVPDGHSPRVARGPSFRIATALPS